MLKWFENHWSLVLVILIGLVPLLWFTPGNIITGTDVDFSPFPQERFDHRLNLWDKKVLGGTDRSNNIASLVYIAPNALLETMGFDIETNQKIGFVLWFELVGLSMYLLMSVIFSRNEKEIYSQNFGKLAASVLYMFSFYNVFLWVRLQLSLTTLIMVPLYIAIIVATQKKVINLKTAISFSIILGVLSAPTGIQPPLLYIFFVFAVIYLLFSILLTNPSVFVLKTKDLFKSWFLIGLFFIVGGLFWLIPLVSFVVSSGYGDSSVGKEIYDVYSLLNWVSQPLSLDNVFRLYGDVIWHDSWDGEPYFPEFESYLHSPILIFSSFILPIVVFLPLALMRRTQYWFFIVFFSFIAVLSILFSKGTHPPFGSIYLWMIDNAPYFWIQRAPWQKFALFTSVSYSILFGFFIYFISRKVQIKSHKKLWNFLNINKYAVAFPILVVSCLLGFNHVFMLGKMFPEGSGSIGYHQVNGFGFHHSYPNYLYSARNFINSQEEEFKIFLLPDEKTSIYNWGYAGAALPSYQLFNKGIISRHYGEGFAPPNSIDSKQSKAIDFLYNDESVDFAKLLGGMNVKYILQRNDFRYDFFDDYDSPKFIKDRLSRQIGISLDKSFGAWDFYKIDNKLFKPLINLTKHTNDSGKPSRFNYLNNTNYIDIEKNNIPFEDNNIDFKRLNNSAILVKLKDIKGRYSLDFLENFDSNWKAYILHNNNHSKKFIEYESLSTKNPVWLNKSTMINSQVNERFDGHAKKWFNSWFIDTNEICKRENHCIKKSNDKYDLLLVLEFWPQKLFHWAALISSLFLFLSLIYLMYIFIFRKNKYRVC